MPTIPVIVVDRISPTVNRLRALNFEQSDSRLINWYRAEGYISQDWTLVVGAHGAAEFDDGGRDPEQNYKYIASYEDYPLELSLEVVDRTNEDPPYYEVEPVPGSGTTITPITKTVSIPWGADVQDVPMFQVDGFRTEWKHGAEAINIGQNQSL